MDWPGTNSPRVAWCNENVGKQYVDWNINMSHAGFRQYTIFIFRTGESALLFALKWK